MNLTDGLDGLATGLSIIGFTMYAIMSFVLDSPAIGAFCIIMIFALLGFLPYNLNPAKVFMGDTGSLALGGIFNNFNYAKSRIIIVTNWAGICN